MDGGDEETPIRGFTLFSVVRDDGPGEWKVKRLDIEFDSIAWAADVETGGNAGKSYNM